MKTKEWLKNIRTQQKLTQQELANKTGVSRFTIENIEQGKRLGSVETWNKLENFFGEYSLEVSYDSDDLIAELKTDIKNLGEDYECYLFYKVIENNIIFTDYDFAVENEKCDPEQHLEENEKYLLTTFKYALDVFNEQNKIL